MRKIMTVAALAVAAMLLGACGTTETPVNSTAAAPSGEPITLTDSRGTEITLDGPATRTVGLEWNVAEHLVSLGVMPVGVSDVEGYTAWVGAQPLDDTVTDVGTRGEPSIDSIAALAPDLIVATDGLDAGAVMQLEAIAPVLVITGADAGKGIGQMREDLELVAMATGKQAEAEQLLADFDAALVEGAEQLEAAGLAGQEFAFMDGYVDGGQVVLRPFAEGSLIASVTEELGLTNAWTQPGDPQYGLGETDVEGLTALGDVEFLYITNDVEEVDPFAELAGNAVWESLPFVQAGNVTRLPDGIWLFGGPTSMEQYVDAAVAALVA